MSYASLAYASLASTSLAPSYPARPILPPFELNKKAIAKTTRATAVGAGLLAQSLAVAGILWMVLAAPGLLTDRSSTTTSLAYALRR